MSRHLMHSKVFASMITIALLFNSVVVAQDRSSPVLDATPLWAFAAPLPRTPVASTIKDQTVPGSLSRYSELELRGRAMAIDWFPSAHPPMPPSVGGMPGLADACAYCHLPDGSGRPENAALAGLPYAYLLQQVQDIKSGARLPIPHFAASQRMLEAIQTVSEADVQAAARYYSKLPYSKRVRVVETGVVPHYTVNGVYLFDGTAAHEPLGERILEGPDDATGFARRDARTTYTAYVPVGSVGRGRVLAQGVETQPASCASCHGAGLRGAVAPPLAGRSPTVIFRQLYAFQHDFRNGNDASLMKPVVAGLSLQSLIDLSAYCASLEP